MTPDEFIAGLSDPQRSLTEEVWAMLKRAFPNAIETCEGGDLGLGFDRGYGGLVFVLRPTGYGVRLGIANGTTLPDPAGLLLGQGKRHRHMRIMSRDEAERPELAELLGVAVERAGAAWASRP